MDESLTSFRETKNKCAGPKTTVKKKNKLRKVLKRPRGQKDIRTALQSVKNELESYSKDFDKVCKKVGIDIDSEQLQLAIALSKSLQDTASTSESASLETQKQSKQYTIGKIRTTLQEYGFKVPELKIAGSTRKIGTRKKSYKLIQTSEVEKKEIVANRYSYVLFNNITSCSVYCYDADYKNIPLYYLASSVSYDILKLQDTFYIDNLIEKSMTTGSLLRDWSKIPGRPESPKLFEPMSMSFSEIECSQDELDIILSGTFKSCKDIVSKKVKDWPTRNYCKLVTNDTCCTENKNKKEILKNQEDAIIQANENLKPILTLNKYRSCSPDMFGDESDIFEDSKSTTSNKEANHSKLTTKFDPSLQVTDLTELVLQKFQSSPNQNITNRKSDNMELTECVQVQSEDNILIVDNLVSSSQLSQKTNVTKRKSNDFMEITVCVSTSLQSVQSKIDPNPSIIENNISLGGTDTNKIKTNLTFNKKVDVDLTQSLENYNNRNIKSPREYPEKDLESVDLTQSSNTSDELPFVSLTASKNKSLTSEDSNDTIILDANDYAHINEKSSPHMKINSHIDLTQHIQNNEAVTQNHSQSFFDEYNHDYLDSLDDTRESVSDVIVDEENLDNGDFTQFIERQNSNISVQNSNGNIEDYNTKSLTHLNFGKCSSPQVIIEPIPVEDHPSNSSMKSICQESTTVKKNRQDTTNSIQDIDLTQKSDSSEELSQVVKNFDVSNRDNSNKDSTNNNNILPLRNSQCCSSLGKKDNISIDYDDFINTENAHELKNSSNSNSESVICDKSDENIKHFSRNNSFISNCSQNSEIFQISDQELDYSLHKSRLEVPGDNFAFGGISIMDQMSNIGISKKSIETDKNSFVNVMEKVEIITINSDKRENDNMSPIKHRRLTEIATPQKVCSSDIITAITPNNNEVIIKTNNVTPMTDFELMSTPDIHKELDKYGIKPFKRKRAIQLLKHIYNQTHPIIETTEDIASPPKRRKPNEPPSLRKLISPRKLLQNTHLSKHIADIDKGKDNNVIENNKVTSRTIKGKGKGKRSLESRKKDVAEKVCSDNTENVNRSNEVNECLILKEIECSPEDWVFQKREKAKVHTCRVPLHVAFHNYVSTRRDLREAILCYEPVEIDHIHKELVGYGHRYDPKDLLKFLDKKCITVKTTDNDGRNQKR